jgi:hypothetical protein
MLPKNPPPLCHRKQLKLRDQSTAVFVAHKQVFVDAAFALGVGDVRNTDHEAGIGSELQPSG